MKSERSNVSNLATFNNRGGIENSFSRVGRIKWMVRKLLFLNGHHHERNVKLFSAYLQHLTASQHAGLIKFLTTLYVVQIKILSVYSLLRLHCEHAHCNESPILCIPRKGIARPQS
jgi:hypothetical protein